MSLPSRKGWVYDAHASSRASQSWVWEPFEPLGLVWLPSALGAGRVGRPAPLPMGFPLRSYLLRYDHCSNAVVCYVCLHTPFSGTCPDGGRWGWWWAARDVGEARAFETAGRFWTASQSGEISRPWETLLTSAVSGRASGRWSYLVTAIRPALPASLSPRLFHFLASPLSAS